MARCEKCILLEEIIKELCGKKLLLEAEIAKLKEIIDGLREFIQEDDVEKACKQAIKTGSHSDLKKYLAERRKHI